MNEIIFLELINVLFNKKNNENDLKRVCTKIDTINESITVLSKNMIGLSIAVNTFMSEVKKDLPEFADTIISELNNILDDLVYIPKSDCTVDAEDKEDYVLQVYQKLNKRKSIKVYSTKGLYFDGFNFISRKGTTAGSISFTINELELIQDNIESICETLVKNGFKYHMIYNDFRISKDVFPKLLFNIIEGTFNNLEPFTKNPLKKSVNID